MEVIDTEKAASVVLMRVSLSEDEMGVYEAALNYALERLDDGTIEHRFGAPCDEIEGMRDDLRDCLIESIMGKYSDVRTSSDEFNRRKQDEVN